MRAKTPTELLEETCASIPRNPDWMPVCPTHPKGNCLTMHPLSIGAQLYTTGAVPRGNLIMHQVPAIKELPEVGWNTEADAIAKAKVYAVPVATVGSRTQFKDLPAYGYNYWQGADGYTYATAAGRPDLNEPDLGTTGNG